MICLHVTAGRGPAECRLEIEEAEHGPLSANVALRRDSAAAFADSRNGPVLWNCRSARVGPGCGRSAIEVGLAHWCRRLSTPMLALGGG